MLPEPEPEPEPTRDEFVQEYTVVAIVEYNALQSAGFTFTVHYGGFRVKLLFFCKWKKHSSGTSIVCRF